MDIAEPSRPKLRSEIDAPKCKKSSTAIDEPNLAKLLKDMVEPM
jgi:hypothetical protein